MAGEIGSLHVARDGEKRLGSNNCPKGRAPNLTSYSDTPPPKGPPFSVVPQAVKSLVCGPLGDM